MKRPLPTYFNLDLQIGVYAGTSPSGLILKSIDNGLTFTNMGNVGHGNPTCFCQLTNGDLLYGTDTGYVVNYTQGTSLNVSANEIFEIVPAVIVLINKRLMRIEVLNHCCRDLFVS